MELNLTGCDDNNEATQKLATWCSDLGFNAEMSKGKASFLLTSHYRWNCNVKAHAKQNHRLLITALFNMGNSKLTRSQWHEFTNRLNEEQNVCKFCYDSDGDLQIQVSMPFLDKLSPRAFRNFLSFSEEAVGYFLEKERSLLGGNAD